MATVGAGIKPEMRDEARAVWKLLAGAQPLLEDAIQELYVIEQMTADLTFEVPNMFNGIDPLEWKAAGAFVPSVFQAELRLP